MKALIIIIITSFLFAANYCYSQITTIAVKEKKDTIEVQKYDSLESLNQENVIQHVGQTLFIKGGEYAKKKGFFSYFFTEKTAKDSYIYKPTPGDRAGSIVSSYSELVGKYYKILSIEPGDPYMSKATYWIKLVGSDNITFYFWFTDSFYYIDFVTLGYYEKMKQLFVGKEFYSTGSSQYDKSDTIGTIKVPVKTKFKCTDIAVKVGENSHIFAVLENSKYGEIKGDITKHKKLHMLISTSEYDKFVRKYGASYGSYVAEGRLKIGMNKKMVRDAWGSPDHINKSEGSYGVQEQWVYGRQYLYFKNGVLTSMQL